MILPIYDKTGTVKFTMASSQTQELDNMGVFYRSLKLLHSSEENSVDQLRLVLEESFKNKYGSRKPINLVGFGISKKSSNSDDLTSGKRMKLNDNMSPTLYAGREDESQTSGSDSEGGVALEILDDDLSCVVCQEMAVGANNNLVECLECHSLYHQECHKPMITQDVNDPRFVWYCESCTKTMTKVGVSNSSKDSSTNSNLQPTKPIKSSNKPSQNSSSSKTYNALGISGKSMSSSKNSTSGNFNAKSVNSVPVPKINVTADKRIQMMKKNSTSKKHEKRKSSK